MDSRSLSLAVFAVRHVLAGYILVRSTCGGRVLRLCADCVVFALPIGCGGGFCDLERSLVASTRDFGAAVIFVVKVIWITAAADAFAQELVEDVRTAAINAP